MTDKHPLQPLQDKLEVDDKAMLRIYAAMLQSAEQDARRYRTAWQSASRRARAGGSS